MKQIIIFAIMCGSLNASAQDISIHDTFSLRMRTKKLHHLGHEQLDSIAIQWPNPDSMHVDSLESIVCEMDSLHSILWSVTMRKKYDDTYRQKMECFIINNKNHIWDFYIKILCSSSKWTQNRWVRKYKKLRKNEEKKEKETYNNTEPPIRVSSG